MKNTDAFLVFETVLVEFPVFSWTDMTSENSNTMMKHSLYVYS